MFIVIIYAIIMAVVFSFCYLGHRQINYMRSSYEDGDSVFFAVPMAIFLAAYNMVLWPISVHESLQR